MSKIRVILVEDETIVAEDIKSCLLNLGYEVVAAVASGEDAVESVGNHMPDIVLMDIVLQGEMNGIQAAHKIQSLYDVPVIYLSAFANRLIIKRMHTDQNVPAINKPFEEQELKTLIESTLEKRRLENNK